MRYRGTGWCPWRPAGSDPRDITRDWFMIGAGVMAGFLIAVILWMFPAAG
jgi:hypothetical protein